MPPSTTTKLPEVDRLSGDVARCRPKELRRVCKAIEVKFPRRVLVAVHPDKVVR
jgi:hypothetical protein